MAGASDNEGMWEGLRMLKAWGGDDQIKLQGDKRYPAIMSAISQTFGRYHDETPEEEGINTNTLRGLCTTKQTE